MRSLFASMGVAGFRLVGFARNSGEGGSPMCAA